MGQGNPDERMSEMQSPVQGQEEGGPRPQTGTGQGRAKKPTKVGDVITIAQVRAVAELVTLVGGFDRCHELLGVVRDVGGLKRMKDLLEALAAAQVGPSKV